MPVKERRDGSRSPPSVRVVPSQLQAPCPLGVSSAPEPGDLPTVAMWHRRCFVLWPHIHRIHRGGSRGLSEPRAVQRCPEYPLTLVARAVEQGQEGRMELISRMMDGSVSYDGEHRLEPVLSRAAVREDQSRFKALAMFEGCTKKQLRNVANIARILDAPAGSVLTRAGDPGD